MFERFTDRARRVLVLAQEEARLLNHNFIDTEHILLGLIRESEGVAAQALAALGISLEAVRERLEGTRGPADVAPGGLPPFTPQAKKVLELSLGEALRLGHNYIGTEHLLLGLIREGGGDDIGRSRRAAGTKRNVEAPLVNPREEHGLRPMPDTPSIEASKIVVLVAGGLQYELADSLRPALDGLDGALVRAVQTGDETGFAACRVQLLKLLATAGRPLLPDDNREPDVIVPSADMSLAEARQLMAETEESTLRSAGPSRPSALPGHEGLRHEGKAAQLLVSLGVDPSRVQQQVIQLISGYGGKEGGSGQAPPAAPGLRPRIAPPVGPGKPPTCPACGAGFAEHAVWTTLSIPSAAEGGAHRSFTVISCWACGTLVAVFPGDTNPH